MPSDRVPRAVEELRERVCAGCWRGGGEFVTDSTFRRKLTDGVVLTILLVKRLGWLAKWFATFFSIVERRCIDNGSMLNAVHYCYRGGISCGLRYCVSTHFFFIQIQVLAVYICVCW